MFVGHIRLALALAIALPAVGVAQGFEYAPSSGQYRVTQKTKAAQEVMGQKQEFESTTNQLLTVTLARPKKDTLIMTVVVDSISQVMPMGSTPGIERLVGLRADAKLSPAGTVYSVQGPKDTTIAGADAITEALGRFLPRIRAKLSKGSIWADTTSGKVKQGGMDIERKTLTRYTVAGDTTVGGEKSWKVVREDSTSLTGSGTAQGQPLTMEGTSVGKGAMFVSDKGAFVGAEGEEQSNVKLVLAGNGMEINVVTTTNTKVERMKK